VGLIIGVVVIACVTSLLFFAIVRMKKLRSMSASLRIPHVLYLSFRANAEDEQKELPPPTE
jgi:hypothetical protein